VPGSPGRGIAEQDEAEGLVRRLSRASRGGKHRLPITEHPIRKPGAGFQSGQFGSRNAMRVGSGQRNLIDGGSGRIAPVTGRIGELNLPNCIVRGRVPEQRQAFGGSSL